MVGLSIFRADDVDYIFGLPGNSVLDALVDNLRIQHAFSTDLRGGTVIMMTSIGVPRTPQKDFWNTRSRRFVSAVS